MRKLPAQKVNGLIDGMEVLQELAMSVEPIAGKDLAEKLNLNPVRVNRLLKTLDYLGFAHQDISRRYSIGTAIHLLAAQSMNASRLLSQVLPHLHNIGKDSKVVALGVLWKDKVCYLYHNNQNNDFEAGLGHLDVYPVLDSSIGVMLLSQLEPEEQKLILGKRYTSEVKKLLHKTNKNHFAAIKHADHISLAVPIGIPAYAAVAVSSLKNIQEKNKYLRILKNIAESVNSYKN